MDPHTKLSKVQCLNSHIQKKFGPGKWLKNKVDTIKLAAIAKPMDLRKENQFIGGLPRVCTIVMYVCIV